METYKVHIETTAITDLGGIADYITNVLKEPKIAVRILSSIEEKILSLDKLPHRHATVQDEPYKSRGVRWMLAENYLVFFVINEKDKLVRVFRVSYNRRNWQNLL